MALLDVIKTNKTDLVGVGIGLVAGWFLEPFVANAFSKPIPMSAGVTGYSFGRTDIVTVGASAAVAALAPDKFLKSVGIGSTISTLLRAFQNYQADTSFGIPYFSFAGLSV